VKIVSANFQRAFNVMANEDYLVRGIPIEFLDGEGEMEIVFDDTTKVDSFVLSPTPIQKLKPKLVDCMNRVAEIEIIGKLECKEEFIFTSNLHSTCNVNWELEAEEFNMSHPNDSTGMIIRNWSAKYNTHTVTDKFEGGGKYILKLYIDNVLRSQEEFSVECEEPPMEIISSDSYKVSIRIINLILLILLAISTTITLRIAIYITQL